MLGGLSPLHASVMNGCRHPQSRRDPCQERELKNRHSDRPWPRLHGAVCKWLHGGLGRWRNLVLHPAGFGWHLAASCSANSGCCKTAGCLLFAYLVKALIIVNCPRCLGRYFKQYIVIACSACILDGNQANRRLNWTFRGEMFSIYITKNSSFFF